MKQETQCRVYGSSQIISQILIFILIIIWWDFVFISTSQRATNTQTYKLRPRLIWIWIKKKWINSDDDSMLWTMASSRIERQKTKPVAGLFIRLAMRAMREQKNRKPTTFYRLSGSILVCLQFRFLLSIRHLHQSHHYYSFFIRECATIWQNVRSDSGRMNEWTTCIWVKIETKLKYKIVCRKQFSNLLFQRKEIKHERESFPLWIVYVWSNA